MKTRVPETITCVNCSHSIVIKLYEVDTTINSAQGHFHTIHHPAEPGYTVYCINCGHFMTNDPRPAPAKPAATATRAPRSITEKRTASTAQATAPSREPKKAAKTSVSERPKKREPNKAAAAAKPRHKPVQARKKSQASTDNKKSASAKQPRPQRKKAK